MSQTLLNNRYQIVSSLARGGFGETFLAIDTYLPSGKKCVIKQLKPSAEMTQSTGWLKDRFEKEAIILEELGNNCAQIPKLYAYFSEGGDFYLVQEWIDGMTLTELWHKHGNFSESQVESLLIDILPVLDYIHNQQIIHRDIKPDNIIIRKFDGKPVLIDFGIIKEKVSTQLRRNQQSSIVLGTPGYMPSEQAAGRPVYSSDLYSLGLTAVFMLTGQNAEDFAIDHNTGELLWRKALKNSHSQLVTILEKVIRFHPKDRFSSAKEVLAAIKRVPTQTTTRAFTKVIIPPNSPKRAKSQNNQSQTTFEAKDTYKKGLGCFSWLAIIVVSIGGFVLGFNLIKWRQYPRINPAQPVVNPSPIVPSPTSSIIPTPQPTPSPREYRRKRRRPLQATRSPTPKPLETVHSSPIPTSSPSPSPMLEVPVQTFSPLPSLTPKSQTTHKSEPLGTQVIPVEPPDRVPEPSQQ